MITNLLIESWGYAWAGFTINDWSELRWKKKFHFKKTYASPLRCCLSFICSSGFPLESQSISNYGSVFFFSTYQTYLRLVKLNHYNNAVCLFALLMRWVCILIVCNSLFEPTYAARVHHYGVSRQTSSLLETGFLLNPTVSPCNRNLGYLVIGRNCY